MLNELLECAQAHFPELGMHDERQDGAFQTFKHS